MFDPARSERRGAVTLLAPATLFVLIMLVGPLALLGRFSLNRFDPTEVMIAALTTANYARFFSDPFYRDVLVTTVHVSVVVTLACLVFGMPMAWRLARSTSRFKSIWLMLTILPLFVGAVTRTSGWMIMFARGGMLDVVGRWLATRHIEVMFTENAVIAGIVSINLPFTILALQSVFEGIDPRLEEAASSMGATPARAFRRIILPLALPGILIAAVLCFILCMSAFATPLLLGGPRFHMMAPLVYWEFTNNNNWPFAAALALVLMATTLCLTGLANLAIRRQ
jgi:putative spermidine/putrescine transport system permease protein